jgi:hypothetical protein
MPGQQPLRRSALDKLANSGSRSAISGHQATSTSPLPRIRRIDCCRMQAPRCLQPIRDPYGRSPTAFAIMGQPMVRTSTTDLTAPLVAVGLDPAVLSASRRRHPSSIVTSEAFVPRARRLANAGCSAGSGTVRRVQLAEPGFDRIVIHMFSNVGKGARAPHRKQSFRRGPRESPKASQCSGTAPPRDLADCFRLGMSSGLPAAATETGTTPGTAASMVSVIARRLRGLYAWP